jgi:hypothetical protein
MAVFALGVWSFHSYVWYRYVETRPVRPDPSQGRVYVRNNHGTYRYLTKQEDNLLTETTALAFGLAVFSGLIRYFILGEKVKKPQPWEKKQF